MTNPNKKKAADDFLPMSKKAMKRRGWSRGDFVFYLTQFQFIIDNIAGFLYNIFKYLSILL